VFQHHPNHHGLYTVFHQYFSQKWESHDIPDYDLDTDELVYRGINGEEIERVPFSPGRKHGGHANAMPTPEVTAPLPGRPSFPIRENLFEVKA